ncbi:MAG: glycosyltransferase family 2 protein [Chitinophagales bacterium]|nr:glycosyltransferase family 2 protein [Chitinophagales bacterium]
MSQSISVVVPVYNEEENIISLYNEIKTVCENEKLLYEIIVVDDGSQDKTPEIVKTLSPLRYVRFRRNFGQTAALDAGIKSAKHAYIITMDGDGQNDPKEIPNLIHHLEANRLDVVSGWRVNRKDTFLKKFVSRGAHFLRKMLINDGIHDSGCTLKIYKHKCFDNISLYGEMHRFIPALLKIKGFRIGEIPVNHRPRTAGKTKYNWRRTVKGFIDMVSVWFWNKFAARPLHLLGGIGLFILFLAFISAVITIKEFIEGKGMSESAWPLLTTFLFLAGIQLFISGLIADILIKNYFETTKDVYYAIDSTEEF